MSTTVERIVSGGQTGADRAALDWAIDRGIPHGGSCPRGRRAEDGPIDSRYRLTETASRDYAERTERNVLAADATVVLGTRPSLTGGSKLTVQLARRHGRPCAHFHGDVREAARKLRDLVERQAVRTLNVAGPRASQDPGAGAFVRAVLDAAFPAVADRRGDDAGTSPSQRDR